MFSHKIWRLLDTSEIYFYFLRKPNLKFFCTFPHRQENKHTTLKENQTIKPFLKSTASDLKSSGKMKAKRLSVEGNIAVGKSTFLRLLSRVNPDWSLVTEPLKKWQNIQTTAQPQDFSQDMGNLLQLIYKDPARWSYTFQTFSCLSRFRIQIEPLPEQLLKIKEPVQIFERSIYSDRYVFALTLSKLGHMNAVEWAMYQEWHSFLMQEFDERVALDGIVYLRANPEKCFERLQKRAREEEMTVQQNYLENLHEQHENWLARKTTNVQFQKVKNIPVLMLDVNEDFENNSDASDLLSHKVKDFIADL